LAQNRVNHPHESSCDLIIPALNEAQNIAALGRALQPLRDRGVLRRVILCDNGSTDATAELARGLGFIVVEELEPGYGSACLAGLDVVEQSGRPPAVVAFLDADLSDDPSHLPELIEPIVTGEADLVIGSRVNRAEPGALEAHQRLGNRLACTLMRWATGHAWSDLGPMRAMRWIELLNLEMTDRTWGWTVEMQYKAASRGLRCKEVDVPYRRRHAGRSKISGSITGSYKAGKKIITTIYKLWRTEH